MFHKLSQYIRSFNSTRYQLSCHLLLFVLVLAVASLLGCNKRYSDMPAYSPIPLRNYENHSVGRFKSTHLAEQLDEYYRGVNPGPIGITTFVNLDDLYTTSTFGRVYAEQVMSELSMRGYDVIELRHADALQFLVANGEYALSRDIAAVRRERDLGALIVGTYVVSPVRVYVNARLVDPSTSMVLSAGSVEMAKTKEIAKLVRGGSFAPTLERIPVRHLGLNAYPLYGPSHLGRMYDLEESGGYGMPSMRNGGQGYGGQPRAPRGLNVEPRLDDGGPTALRPVIPGHK
ncbi:FlgO family outer membrane protein [Oligoflexia bacterium]|nr:FlgO family outer membrane protein [Oligoflexia bacterium]